MWNNFKTTILLAGLTGLFLAIGELWGGERGIIFALVLAGVMNLGTYFFSDKIALSMSGARPIAREEDPRIYQIVERLAGKAAIPVPKIYKIPTNSPNAFATGRNPNHASVAVTQGILELCDDEEIEGVLAHELGHVRNRDILTSAIVATIAGAITLIARIVFWGAFRSGHDDSGAARSDFDSTGDFPLPGVRGGRDRGPDYRQSSGPGARVEEDRRVVQARPDAGVTFHGAHVHLPAAHRPRNVLEPFLHAPAHQKAHRAACRPGILLMRESRGGFLRRFPASES